MKAWVFLLGLFCGAVMAAEPVLVGADLEIGHISSSSDDAIILGIETAIEEINRAGGVLRGRPLKLVAMDNRAMPARGRENIEKMIATPDLVAVIAGKFTPVAMDELDLVNGKGLPMLIPWAAGDALIDNGASPNYVFRLSTRDTWAMERMIDSARRRGFSKLGLLVPANAWGRSCIAAAEAIDKKKKDVAIVAVQYFYWHGEKSFARYYANLQAAGSQAVLLVMNENDAVVFVGDVAARPPADRLPIFSHWGVMGGRFVEMSGPALFALDFSVIQTRSVSQPRNAAARHLAEVGINHFRVNAPGKIPSVTGLSNSYDLTHLLARAIDQAGSTDRAKIRDALEHLPPWDGVVRYYQQPFSPTRHEALGPEDVGMYRFERDGRLVPATR